MAEKLKQPAVRHYQHWLSNDLRHGFDSYTYGEETTKLLDELFALVKTIAPYRKNGARELWFRVERGTPEDYGDVNEAIEYGDFKNADEFYDNWKWEFPSEFEWYNFAAFEAEDSKYRVIFLGHKVVISECDRDDPTPLRYDISEFVQWLIDSVSECIAMLKDGTYNDFVRENLPPEHRTGTILRKHYWDVWPECREEFFKDISKEDVEEICELAYAQRDETDLIPLKEMAANDFYRFCAMGYAENNYDGCDKTPKEQYYLHADGRDEGLADIEPDSPEAFYKWYTGNRGGGHPWEVCRGGNSTHVSLYVHRKENGYTLTVAGDAWNRTIETVKFYLALKRAGLPVLLDEAEMLADRLMEKEKIGIVPSGVFPDYCESWFPNEHIIDFMNLPYEDTEKFLPFCVWQDIEPVYLINQRKKAMSYEIRLCDPVTGDVINLDHPHLMRGGTYAMDGTTEMWLNVTYNYSKHYYRPDVFGEKGIRSIYGMTGAKSIPILERAISALGDDVASDYWLPTEGNAKRPLAQLLAMAHMRPDGVWKGD